MPLPAQCKWRTYATPRLRYVRNCASLVGRQHQIDYLPVSAKIRRPPSLAHQHRRQQQKRQQKEEKLQRANAQRTRARARLLCSVARGKNCARKSVLCVVCRLKITVWMHVGHAVFLSLFWAADPDSWQCCCVCFFFCSLPLRVIVDGFTYLWAIFPQFSHHGNANAEWSLMCQCFYFLLPLATAAAAAAGKVFVLTIEIRAGRRSEKCACVPFCSIFRWERLCVCVRVGIVKRGSWFPLFSPYIQTLLFVLTHFR